MMTRFTKTVAKVGIAAAVLAGAALGMNTRTASADQIVCAAGRPCITDLHVSLSANWQDRLIVKWTGTYEVFNIRWSGSPQAEVSGSTHSSSLEDLEWWGHTYTFSVQGCETHFAAPSTCTPWATRQITLSDPEAPKDVKVAGGRVSWTTTDPMTFGFKVEAHIAGGYETWKYLDGDARNLLLTALDAKHADEITEVRVCGRNPGDDTCSKWVDAVAPAPVVTGPKANAPATFKAERQGGFGSRIILSWSDVSNETYYYLTATSQGQPLAFPLGGGAPKLGANSTTFIVDGDAAAVVGGLEFHLQACNANGCSAAVTATVQ